MPSPVLADCVGAAGAVGVAGSDCAAVAGAGALGWFTVGAGAEFEVS
jgi:hypothetical protein